MFNIDNRSENTVSDRIVSEVGASAKVLTPRRVLEREARMNIIVDLLLQIQRVTIPCVTQASGRPSFIERSHTMGSTYGRLKRPLT